MKGLAAFIASAKLKNGFINQPPNLNARYLQNICDKVVDIDILLSRNKFIYLRRPLIFANF